MRIEFSKEFRRDLRHLNDKQFEQFKKRLTLFANQPSHPLLHNHQLKGKLKGYCSFNITGDLRVQYRIEGNLEHGTVIKMVCIGTHSQLY
ncbi:type II toxin-antitoxin system mRNA interferase toxin, RelE/StbE family [Candidatus Peregrinibacteria bacterium]|nr:type II toxin-antitoxin system mRNA interferase toxin, RelE/StbE family [Candidatus Peregrinibacteria bacterium]